MMMVVVVVVVVAVRPAFAQSSRKIAVTGVIIH